MVAHSGPMGLSHPDSAVPSNPLGLVGTPRPVILLLGVLLSTLWDTGSDTTGPNTPL